MALGLAWCPAPRPARPRSHIVPKAPLVVLVFSFWLSQTSPGRVAFSISAFGVFSTWKGMSGSSPCPLAMLKHHFNLPLRSLSVKESHLIESRLAAKPFRASLIPQTRVWSAFLCRLFPLSSGCNACPHKSHLLRLEIRASFWNRMALEEWPGFQGTHSFLSRGFAWYWPRSRARRTPSSFATAPPPQQRKPLRDKTLRKRKLLWGSSESRRKYSLPATHPGWIRGSTCCQANMWS